MKSLNGVHIGLAMGASHCNMERAIRTVSLLQEAGCDITPILSANLLKETTRFGGPENWVQGVIQATGRQPLTTVPEVEPLGPKHWFDVILLMPCTGNTVAKIANAINDSVITMAAKAQLRNGRPVVLSVTSNDLLGMNAQNLGKLLAVRNVYFVPFGQDDPNAKPRSLDAHMELVVPTIEAALEGQQVQPILVGW